MVFRRISDSKISSISVLHSVFEYREVNGECVIDLTTEMSWWQFTVRQIGLIAIVGFSADRDIL